MTPVPHCSRLHIHHEIYPAILLPPLHCGKPAFCPDRNGGRVGNRPFYIAPSVNCLTCNSVFFSFKGASEETSSQSVIQMFRAFFNRTAICHSCSEVANCTSSLKRSMCTRKTNFAEEEQMQILRGGIAPATGRPLKDIAAEIWGHTRDPVGPGHRSGEKLLRRPLKGPLYTSWYPPPLYAYKSNPFKLTEKQMRWKEKLKILRASGKGPPKKGSGKRAK